VLSGFVGFLICLPLALGLALASGVSSNGRDYASVVGGF